MAVGINRVPVRVASGAGHYFEGCGLGPAPGGMGPGLGFGSTGLSGVGTPGGLGGVRGSPGDPGETGVGLTGGARGELGEATESPSGI